MSLVYSWDDMIASEYKYEVYANAQENVFSNTTSREEIISVY